MKCVLNALLKPLAFHFCSSGLFCAFGASYFAILMVFFLSLGSEFHRRVLFSTNRSDFILLIERQRRALCPQTPKSFWALKLGVVLSAERICTVSWRFIFISSRRRVLSRSARRGKKAHFCGQKRENRRRERRPKRAKNLITIFKSDASATRIIRSHSILYFYEETSDLFKFDFFMLKALLYIITSDAVHHQMQ